MIILIACEESQRVTEAFRKIGHTAYSCDILDTSGNHPEWHIKGDVSRLLNGNTSFFTEDGVKHEVVEKWDMIIAFPPCTYLTVTGNRWFNIDKYGDDALERIGKRKKAAKFFMDIANADCEKIAIENPVGYMNTYYRKPDQIIQPYQFGDPFEKKTCLWLKGLNPLEYTNVVEPPPRQKLRSGKSMPVWYSNAPHKDRARLRAVTFPGVANAMAEQWGK